MSVSSTHIFMPGFSATAHVVNHMFPVDCDFKCDFQRSKSHKEGTHLSQMESRLFYLKETVKKEIYKSKKPNKYK